MRDSTNQASSQPAQVSSHQLLTSARLDYAFALLAAGLAFALYLRTLAPGLLGGDSGEFQFAAWLGGFTHPTGYPLYLILGWLWTHLLPWADPAWRMNLFSALWGGVAVGLVYLLALRAMAAATPQKATSVIKRSAGAAWQRRLIAFGAALTFAVTPTFWSQAVVAEVYTLHAAFIAAILLALLAWAERIDDTPGRPPIDGMAQARLLAVLYGASLAHHRTMLLVAPALAFFVFWTMGAVRLRQLLRSNGRALLILAACFLAPLLLYLYIPLRAPHVPYFQMALGPGQVLPFYEPTLAGFLAHISGSTFGSALGVQAGLGAALTGLALRLRGEFSWVGVALGLMGLVRLAWLRARAWLGLTGLAFLAIVGFNLVYGIGDIYVFYIPAYLIWTLWLAIGVAALGGWVLGRMADGKSLNTLFAARNTQHAARASCFLIFLSPLLLALVLLCIYFPQVDRSHDTRARVTWEAILAQPIPQGAALISNDRDEMTPLWYLIYVEGRRTDLVGLFPRIQPGPDWADVGQVTGQALHSGRPTFLIKPMPGLDAAFRLASTPLSGGEGPIEGGDLTQVVGRAAEQPPQRPSAATFGEALRLTGYDVMPGLAHGGSEATVALYWQPLHDLVVDYTSFVHVVNADGVTVGQSDHRPGGIYYPTSLWRTRAVLRDEHRVRLNADLGRPPYALQVGLYTGAAEALAHLGEPQRIGWLLAAQPPATLPADRAGQVAAVFGREIALLGYTRQTDDRGIGVRLYWQAHAAPATDYTLFLHLVDAAGQIVAQHDGPPAGAAAPTGGWPRDFTFAADVTIARPAGGLPPGVYRLVAGLYDPVTLARLTAVDGGGQTLGDSILLEQITVGR